VEDWSEIVRRKRDIKGERLGGIKKGNLLVLALPRKKGGKLTSGSYQLKNGSYVKRVRIRGMIIWMGSESGRDRIDEDVPRGGMKLANLFLYSLKDNSASMKGIS